MVCRQEPVKVLDSIMGSGKTTAMFKLMSDGYSEGGKKYLYVSLFLSEVGDGRSGKEKAVKGRIHDALPEMNFNMPKNLGKGKRENIKDLLKKGSNISTTHASFKSLDKEAIDLLIDRNYTLVIDEAVDCISEHDDLDKQDLDMLVAGGRIRVEADGKLIWVGERLTEKSVHFTTMTRCETESLYLYSDSVLVWEYPPLLLKVLSDVYVITYLFEGSIMWAWMEKNGIQYEKLPPSELGLRSESEIKKEIRGNLTLVKSNKLSALRRAWSVDPKENPLSSGWCKRNFIKDGAKNDEGGLESPSGHMVSVTKVMESCVTRSGVKIDHLFWTSFKDYQRNLRGKGFSRLSKGKLPPFLPWNTKATNDYRDHTLCMYTVNLYKSVREVQYLASRGITFNEDLYSTSEMLQFVFRGSLRKGEAMQLLVVSERMEDLLLKWLGEGV